MKIAIGAAKGLSWCYLASDLQGLQRLARLARAGYNVSLSLHELDALGESRALYTLADAVVV